MQKAINNQDMRRIMCSTIQPESAHKAIQNKESVDVHLSLAWGCEKNDICPLQ